MKNNILSDVIQSRKKSNDDLDKSTDRSISLRKIDDNLKTASVDSIRLVTISKNIFGMKKHINEIVKLESAKPIVPLNRTGGQPKTPTVTSIVSSKVKGFIKDNTTPILIGLAVAGIGIALTLAYDKIKSIFADAFGGLTEFGTEIFDKVQDFISGSFDSIVKFGGEIYDKFKSSITGAFDSIKDFGEASYSGIKNSISNISDNILVAKDNVLSFVKSSMLGKTEPVLPTITPPPSNLYGQDTYSSNNTGSADTKTRPGNRGSNRNSNSNPGTVPNTSDNGTNTSTKLFGDAPQNSPDATSTIPTQEGTSPSRNGPSFGVETGGGAVTSMKRGSSNTTPGSLKSQATSQPFEGSQKQFYDKMYATLLSEATKQGVENPEAIARVGTAQSVIETGYGKHLAGGNNYFGIKARPGEGGPAQQTQEFINGKMVTINDKFRSYNNMEESTADYVKFLRENSRYKETLAAKTVDEAISSIGRSGYATDPGYTTKLKSINGSGMAGNLPGSSATSGIREGRGVGPDHNGIDIAAPIGTPVQATSDGRVVVASFEPKGYSDYGNIVVLESVSNSGEKIYTKYAHLSSFDVKVGDAVEKGTKIGAVGNTGRSSGPHLHYEMRKNDPIIGTVVDPKMVSAISPMEATSKPSPPMGLKGQARQLATQESAGTVQQSPSTPPPNKQQVNLKDSKHVFAILLHSIMNNSGYIG